MSSPITALVTIPPDLTQGLNTLWITNNGALSPIFITVDSTTTQVIGGAVPSSASVVVVAAASSSSSTPAQTSEVEASPSSIAGTLTVLLPTTPLPAPAPQSLQTTPGSNAGPAMQTVTSLSTNEDLGMPVSSELLSQNPPPTTTTSSSSSSVSEQTLGMPSSTASPAAAARARGQDAGGKQHRTETLVLAVVLTVVACIVVTLLVWRLLVLTARRKKRSLGAEAEAVDEVEERKEWLSGSSDGLGAVQELEATPRRG
ncbi:hypothetical protein B0A55_03609 [Friedmanniomyces simplex]|uniref:Uncharacterized protein n=1 Tax=Friedmanniomyces simplex TaxID=329884 RepID=A0A4U0XYC0_9PEZI|nr:hypothetical protein B0A55_03609 [Friedmanniomyces simplex]